MPRGDRNRWGGRRETTRPDARQPGRPPVKAMLKEGVIVLISQVWASGDSADLGRGVVGEIKRLKGGDRCVVIPQNDGSELRIVIGEND